MGKRNLLVDAGFLVALWRGGDVHHAWAVETARFHPPVWITCEAALSEAEHLLGERGAASLRTACRRGALRVESVLAGDMGRVMDLLDKYNDVPMSLADACLVRMTEIDTQAAVITTDQDFRIYRRFDRRVVPCLFP